MQKSNPPARARVLMKQWPRPVLPAATTFFKPAARLALDAGLPWGNLSNDRIQTANQCGAGSRSPTQRPRLDLSSATSRWNPWPVAPQMTRLACGTLRESLCWTAHPHRVVASLAPTVAVGWVARSGPVTLVLTRPRQGAGFQLGCCRSMIRALLRHRVPDSIRYLITSWHYL